MRIRKVHQNQYGQPVYRDVAGASIFAKAVLAGSICAGLFVGGYAYEKARQASHTVETSGHEVVISQPVSLESKLQKTTPLPHPSVAKLYSSNKQKKYAENNVKQLQQKGISAYLVEAWVGGQKVYRTLVDLLPSNQEPAHPKKVEKPKTINYFGLKPIEKIIYDEVAEYNKKNTENTVDFDLARAIAYCESRYDPRAVATKTVKIKGKKVKIKLGRGLFQLMPETAKAMGGRNYTEKELLDAKISADLGVKYLGYLQTSPHVKIADTKEAQLERILAAYNGGEPAIMPSDNNPDLLRYEHPENYRYGQTRAYVPKVMRKYSRFSGQPTDG